MSTRKQTYKLLLIHSADSNLVTHIPALLQNDFQVFQTVDLTRAIKIAAQYTPNIIVIDLTQADTETEALTKQLRNDPLTRSIPLLLSTTFTASKSESLELHFQDCDLIGTPYSAQELITRIERQLAIAQSEHKLYKENQKLKTTLEARDKLYALIAHDLRAPIGTIKMLNATIATQIHQISNNYVITLFNMLQGTTEEAFNLLENLLNWIQTQHEKTKIEAKKFDINRTIHQTVTLFQAHLLQKEIALQEHSLHPTEVYADEEMIKTVLRNLIFNAIKFTYPGGKIEVTTTDLPKHILISVKDTGKGISATEQEKIKKANSNHSTYGTQNEPGHGLGLSISREFVKLNKGKLWFSSQEGVGTTFFFTLPHP